MKQLIHILSDMESLQRYLKSNEVRECLEGSGSCLGQMYSMPDDPLLAVSVATVLQDALPGIVVVGASTVGEVAAGRTMTGSTLIVLSFFENTQLNVIARECYRGDEYPLGQEIAHQLMLGGTNLVGVFLLATPLSLDVNPLLKGIGEHLADIPVFGGGAGDYAAMQNSWVLLGQKTMQRGVIAVALHGSALRIQARTSLGWHALSKEMTVTSVDGLKVLTIDNRPALEVYRRYIETDHNEEFALTASEFPFLIERNGEVLARVPMDVGENNELVFMADIAAGDRFRIGYGDPARMLANARDLHDSIHEFCPQGIFVFVCGCRRYLLQDNAELETRPFQVSAPTAGFYTYGEFYGRGEEMGLLNATLLAVGLREGDPVADSQRQLVSPDAKTAESQSAVKDPYARQHARVVSSLVRFISTVTGELEEANRQLSSYSNHLEALVDERTAALSIAKEAAEAASRSKSIFIANLSHELRTPMNGILGMINLAKRRVIDPKAIDYLDKANMAAKNLLSLINDLLDIANIEGERLTLEKSPFRIRDILKNVDTLSREKAARKGLEYFTDIDAGIAEQIFMGDPVRLSQVLLNLTGNAVKFTEAGSIHLRVHLTSASSSEVKLNFSVQDTGIGIPSDDKQRLFKLFEQGDGSSTRKYGGTGLGLILTKRLVEMMGGTIDMTSEPGLGSTFWFSVTLDKAGMTNPGSGGNFEEFVE